MVYNSSIGSYVRTYGTTYIMYDGASYATTSDKLGIESEGDAMELVYHRDLQITINNITYNIDTITIDKVSDLFLIDFELYHHMNFQNGKRKSQICEIPNPTD